MRCAGVCAAACPIMFSGFFHHLYEHLVRDQRQEATLDDVELVYQRDLLSVRGQRDLVHYEERLRMVLGDEGYTDALSLLSEAAVNDGLLTHPVVDLYRNESATRGEGDGMAGVLYVLQHDGYLEEREGGYGFRIRFAGGLVVRQAWTDNLPRSSSGSRQERSAMITGIKKYNPGFLSDDEIVASFCVRNAEFESLLGSLRSSTGNSNVHSLVIGP